MFWSALLKLTLLCNKFLRTLIHLCPTIHAAIGFALQYVLAHWHLCPLSLLAQTTTYPPASTTYPPAPWSSYHHTCHQRPKPFLKIFMITLFHLGWVGTEVEDVGALGELGVPKMESITGINQTARAGRWAPSVSWTIHRLQISIWYQGAVNLISCQSNLGVSRPTPHL